MNETFCSLDLLSKADLSRRSFWCGPRLVVSACQQLRFQPFQLCCEKANLQPDQDDPQPLRRGLLLAACLQVQLFAGSHNTLPISSYK